MDPGFSDWLDIVDLRGDLDARKRMWKAVVEVSKRPTLQQAVAWARLLLLPDDAKDAGTLDDIAAQFRKVDEDFPVGQPKATRILLAGCLARLMTRADSTGIASAYAIRTLVCQGVGSPSWPSDVFRRASRYLQERGLHARDRVARGDIIAFDAVAAQDDDEDFAEVSPSASYGDLAAALVHGNQLTAAVTQLQNTTRELSDAIAENGEILQKAVDIVSQFGRDPAVAILLEETDILWWLFTGFSPALDRGFEDVPVVEGCLVLGAELAQRITILPAPPNTEAFLKRALRASPGANEPVSFQDVVSSAPALWRSQLPAPPLSLDPRLMPVSLALSRAAEANDGSWCGPVSVLTTIKGDSSLPAHKWALQLLEERLLQRIGS
jgi:hypothetical protein